MGETQKTVETQVSDGVAVVRLNNRPANALTPALFADLDQALERVASADVRVVVITGLNRAFSVGGDLSMIALFDSQEEAIGQVRVGQDIITRFTNLQKPLIAAINGLCLGGGLEIALMCHLRVCGTRARFGFPELSVGFIPALGGIGRLTRLVGRAHALEMLLTGRTITAQEAYRIGLVNRCVSPKEVVREAEKLARTVTRAEPAAAAAALELANEPDAEREAELFGILVTRPIVKKKLADIL